MKQAASVSLVRDEHNAWARSPDDVLRNQQVELHLGLRASEAGARQRRYGPNQLHGVSRKSLWSLLLNQVRSVVIVLLIAAAALSIAFGDVVEGVAILVVVLINGVIGFASERHAVRSMEALRKLGRVETIVRREGRITRLAAEELVPGDIVVLQGGDIVTADMRVIEASRLQADESTLTGESIPVAKQVHEMPAETPLLERRNMLFKGSAITRGAATAVVVATGLSTELGKVSQLVTAAKPQLTPLERRLDALGRRLAWAVLLIAILLVAAATVTGRDAVLSIQVAIALAVAAIPEGLPIVATIALARGMWRMSKRNALVARLSAVETLGAASIILTDKTGTLTENRMTVTSLHLGDVEFRIEGIGLETSGAFIADNADATASDLQRVDELLVHALLCCNAELSVNEAGEVEAVGDPTETALLIAAAKRRLDHRELQLATPRIREESFDPQTKSMATYHRRPTDILVAVKGAPEVVLDACTTVSTRFGNRVLTDADRREWRDRAAALGAHGLRTLAVAGKTVADLSEGPYSRLTLFGLVGLEDPPRRGVRLAIERCRNAGIRVVMVTGDHAATARHIAYELGMVADDAAPGSFIDARTRLTSKAEPDIDLMRATVISRATPEQKFDLIARYQQLGHVVAMTGDGVNDAPALRKADIGVAMGLRGTAVAKEAAHMILQDDEFGTIVEAVSQGRAIYANIRKFVVYLLSCNISEIMIVSVATLAGAPLPLLPLQILFLNLVTDVFPALALGVGEGSDQLMNVKPRPARDPILTRDHWARILLYGAVMSVCVLSAMAIAIQYLGYNYEQAVTVSFTTLALLQLWHVFNMRATDSRLLRNEIVRNPWVWAALFFCLLLVLAAVFIPGLQQLLTLTALPASGWLLIVTMSCIPLLLGPLKLVNRQVQY